jgi:YVTN family beta-propeller protein
VAISPDGKHAYVVNERANTVSVIDIATNTVTATVAGGGGSPEGVAVTPDGQVVYVANGNKVSVIATATNSRRDF